MEVQYSMETPAVELTRKTRRAGTEQLKDAVNDIHESMKRLSETNNRILKNKLDALHVLLGKHCGVSVNLSKTRKAKLSKIPEETVAEVTLPEVAAPEVTVPMTMDAQTVPEEAAPGEKPKMMSKARVIDQTFNKFRSDLSDSLKEFGKPLTTEGNKKVSTLWKNAKDGNLNSVKNSLKTLGVPEAQVSSIASRAVDEAKTYLERSKTKKLKATPLTPGKTRKVSMKKPKAKLTVPTTSLEAIPEEAENSAVKKREVEYEGAQYYVIGDTVFEKNEDESVGKSVGTWDEEENKVISL